MNQLFIFGGTPILTHPDQFPGARLTFCRPFGHGAELALHHGVEIATSPSWADLGQGMPRDVKGAKGRRFAFFTRSFLFVLVPNHQTVNSSYQICKACHRSTGSAPCELSCSTTFWNESGSSSSTCSVKGTQIEAKFGQSKFGPRTIKI